MATKGTLEWKKTHLKNLIWSAKTKGSLFGKKDIPRFKKELEKINIELKKRKRG